MSSLSAEPVVGWRYFEILISSKLEQKSDWRSAFVSRYRNIGRGSMKKQVIQIVLIPLTRFIQEKARWAAVA